MIYRLLLQLRTLVRLGWETTNKYSLVLKAKGVQNPKSVKATQIRGINQRRNNIQEYCSFPSSGLASDRFRFLNNPTPTDECSVVQITDKYSPKRQYGWVSECKIRGSIHVSKDLYCIILNHTVVQMELIWNKPVKMRIRLESNTELGASICCCQETTIIMAQDTSFI